MSIGSGSNPVLRDSYFEEAAMYSHSEAMTFEGVVTKTALLVLFALCGASFGWKMALAEYNALSPFVMPCLIVGFLLALATVYKPELSMYTSIPYALAEGFALGAISAIFNAESDGIAMNAILITFSVLFLMLTLYRTGIIEASDNLIRGVVAATGGVALAYVLSLVAHSLGLGLPIHATGPWGIAISLGLCGLAAFNFIVDFEVARRGVESGAPKYMEWYAAFGILVTIIWLYVEVLKLLGRSRRR
jgi:uncharacterized YccA/Bax inhibitor family protein